MYFDDCIKFKYMELTKCRCESESERFDKVERKLLKLLGLNIIVTKMLLIKLKCCELYLT